MMMFTVISHTMRSTISSTKEERSISIFIQRSLPDVTITQRGPLGVKSRKFFTGHHAYQYNTLR
jgi:hypothetical protein